MSLNDVFCKIYVINLKRRVDRRIICAKKMQRIGIKYDFYDAVDGYDEKYNELCKKVETKISRGAIGLILTYMKILDDALCNIQKDDDLILILEDDINFHKDFSNKLQLHIKNQIFKKTDCVWLGANQSSYNKTQKEQISIHKYGYYDVSKHAWCLTYGTFAIGMNKRMIIGLRKSIDINQIIYPIDVQISHVIAENNLRGKVIYPFLIMPDVTDSDNMNPRDQKEFVANRMYLIDDYDFISLHIISEFKKMMNMKHISLRKIFADANAKTESMNITCEEFIKFFESVGYDILEFAKSYCDCFKMNGMINLNDFFYCIEEKKSFVLIITSSNIINYRMIIGSIIKQIYPKYQYRIICHGNRQYMKEYIDKYELNHCITMSESDKTNFCFDDEIMIQMTGEDWLFDEFVLDYLNDQYINNNINHLCASGYEYRIQDMKIGQSMGIPYGNKLIDNYFKSGYVGSYNQSNNEKNMYVNKPLIIRDKTTISNTNYLTQ